jgi:FAD-dependent urate hydroxylase
MRHHTPLLIIGAGPFGLAMSAHARDRGIDHVMLGRPMDFWTSNMPEGMYLRSACDWHLDPGDTHTIERYLGEQELTPADVEPLSLAFYLGYCAWFQRQKGLEAVPRMVRRLDRRTDADAGFDALLDDGDTLRADQVVVAPGFRHFQHVPGEIADLLPAGRYSHTCELVDFTALRGKRCLIVGGRQSAFEWAALLHEAGVAAVDLSHRHPSPAFQEADWSWVSPLVDAMVDDPGWFRNLSREEKEAINHRLWAEGRLKVEPWLGPRLRHPSVTVRPGTRVTACEELPSGELRVLLDDNTAIDVDHVIFATGYKADLARVPYLAEGNLAQELETRDGFPVLDEHLQTSVPGLFITSMPAAQDFGPFFAFTISVRTSARLIGRALRGPERGGAAPGHPPSRGVVAGAVA